MLFIYMADGTKNIQTPGKLANYNFDKDFQLTVTGEETLKETHSFHTEGNFKRHNSVKDNIVYPM